MNRQLSRQRRRTIVFWFFCIVAIPLGAIIVGYASGYRFQRATSSLIQTAALRITTTPKKALIFLDGKLQKQHTPYLEDTILPGTLRVTLEKAGYATWEKQVLFEAGKSNIFSKVILFKKSTPVPILRTEESFPALTFTPLSPEVHATLEEHGVRASEQLQMLAGPAVLLVDRARAFALLLPTISGWNERIIIDGVVVAAVWRRNTQLLIATTHELWRYDVQTQTTELLRRTSDTITDALWHPDGNYIFYSTSENIVAFELDARDVRQQWILANIPHATELRVTEKGSHVEFTADRQRFDLEL